MDSEQISQPTQKALRTRQHILNVALHLFAEKGYEATTMRDIAAEAGCSLGLTYRYFRRKEDLVLALYHWLVEQLEVHVHALPEVSLADRFDQLLSELFLLMLPHRLTLAALFGISLNTRSQAGLFSPDGAVIRQRAHLAYVTLVAGAKDAPRSTQIEEVATMLYGLQLGLVVFWLQDVSEGAQKTRELLALLHDVLQRMRFFLRLPGITQLLTRTVRIIGPMFGYDVSVPDRSTQPDKKKVDGTLL